MRASDFRGSVHAARLKVAADALAIAAAMALPWSTSVTLILLGAWLATLAPTLELAALRRELRSPAGGLPVLLVAVALLGMLWADVTWIERWRGADSYFKLLAIPLLLAQFRSSHRGSWVLAGFLASCSALLIVSFLHVLWVGVRGGSDSIPGVPVRDYIAQSGEFVLCAFGLLGLATQPAVPTRWRIVALLLAVAFLGNVFYVVTGRTAIIVIFVLLGGFALRWFGLRGRVAILLAAMVASGVVWVSSPYLRERVLGAVQEVRDYEAAVPGASAGQRIEYWKKSVGFIAGSPVFGHGTGSIPDLFRRAVGGEPGPYGAPTPNPHNQALAVAVQLGLVGTLLLFALWGAHLHLFRGAGLVNWVGLVIVVENIVGSLFNSHLFDFSQGWLYVLGVGIVGGTALRQGAEPAPTTAEQTPDAAVRDDRIVLGAKPRILVIALRRLGDVLLTTPLIRSIRRAWPDAEIDVLVFAGTAGILEDNPDIDAVILMPERPTARQSLALLRRLLRRYALAVSTQEGDRPTFFAFAAGRSRVGPVGGGLNGAIKRLMLHRVVGVGPGAHRVEQVLRLADVLGIARAVEVVPPRRRIEARPADGLDAPAGYAVIHAAPMFRYKRWTDQGWRDLAEALRRRGLAVVASGGPAEAERSYLDLLWGDIPVQRLDGRLRWPELADLLAGARVYIGPDTAVTHLAAAAGCPTVALYGPTDPRIWGPWPSGGPDPSWAAAAAIQRRGNVWLVQNVLACTPCQLEGCARRLDSHSQCLDELSAASVIAAVDQALAVRRNGCPPARHPRP